MNRRVGLWGRRVGLLLGAYGALALLVAGCGAVETATADIPVQDATLVAAGEVVYQAECAACHGTDLRGTDEGPSQLSELYVPSHHSDAAFLLAIKTGSPEHHWRFGDMEPIEGLDDDDIAALTAYVREVQRIEGFEPYPP